MGLYSSYCNVIHTCHRNKSKPTNKSDFIILGIQTHPLWSFTRQTVKSYMTVIGTTLDTPSRVITSYTGVTNSLTPFNIAVGKILLVYFLSLQIALVERYGVHEHYTNMLIMFQ